jgi:hypothetical protein
MSTRAENVYLLFHVVFMVKNLNSWENPLYTRVLALPAQPLADHAISSYLFSGGLGIGGPNTKSSPHRRFTR